MKSDRLIALALLVFFVSCSSPHSDGERAAKAFNEAEVTFQNDLRNSVNVYIENFNSYGFSSRVEARQKINTLLGDVRSEYDKNIRNAQLLYANLKNENSSTYKDAQSFAEGFEENRRYNKIDTTSQSPILTEINSLIKTIIPPKPTADKIKTDLTGHFWQDKEDGYFGTKRRVIKEGSIADIKIISESNQQDAFLINAIVSIQERKGSAIFKINADIKYILGDADDWEIDYLGSNSVGIVKTGQFDKYIQTRLIQDWSERMEISNLSDATFIVGGIYLQYSQWRKFSIEIAPNSTIRESGIREYEIHFVERR